MLIKLIVCVIFVKCNFSLQFHNKTEIIRLLTDFIAIQNNPTKIYAYLCWKNEYLLTLIKNLPKISISLINPDDGHFHYSVPEEHQLGLIDLECKGSTKILNEADEQNLINQRYRWILLSESNKPNLDSFYFGVNSKVFVIYKTDEKFEIISPYKFVPTSKNMEENFIGSWQYQTGFSEYRVLNTARNRTNLMGNPLRISYVVTNPETYQHFWDYRDTHVDAITKLNYILVHHLSTFINCTIIPIYQPTWGYKNLTTSYYSGLIGDLQKKDADLGGTPAFFTIDRIDFVDYIAATTPTYMRFIFRAPPLSYVTNIFTLPFQTYVWYVCFLMAAVIFIILFIIVIWEWKDPEFKATIKDERRSLKANVFEVAMMEIGAITQQGADSEPHSGGGRIATFFTFLILMFLYNAFSANIVALLQSTTDSIRSLEDLLNSRMKLGVEDIVYAHYYFENAKEPTRKAIYEQKIAPKGQKPSFMTVGEGIQKVRDGFFAFHVELSSGYKVVVDTFFESEKCGLKEIEFINLIEPMMAAQKNSTFNELFKVGMKKMKEAGIQNRELKRIYTRKPMCLTKGSNFGSVGLIDVYAAFLIFGIGIGLTIIIFILEIVFRKYKERNTFVVMKPVCGTTWKNIIHN